MTGHGLSDPRLHFLVLGNRPREIVASPRSGIETTRHRSRGIRASLRSEKSAATTPDTRCLLRESAGVGGGECDGPVNPLRLNLSLSRGFCIHTHTQISLNRFPVRDKNKNKKILSVLLPSPTRNPLLVQIFGPRIYL